MKLSPDHSSERLSEDPGLLRIPPVPFFWPWRSMASRTFLVAGFKRIQRTFTRYNLASFALSSIPASIHSLSVSSFCAPGCCCRLH